jgi:hypothetical protein
MEDDLSYRRKIADAEREVKRAEAEWKLAKDNAKECKLIYDAAVAALRDLASSEDA